MATSRSSRVSIAANTVLKPPLPSLRSNSYRSLRSEVFIDRYSFYLYSARKILAIVSSCILEVPS